MSTDITTAAELHLTGWWEKNKTRVFQIAIIAAVVAFLASFYIWRKNQRETEAAEALSAVTPGADTAQSLLKIAENYSGTAAADRAVFEAAGATFAAGKFDDAGKLFERYLREFPDGSERAAALLGVAACLDSQGKAADAIQKYQDVSQRFSSSPAAANAKASLARLYEAQGKPELALPLYQELSHDQNTSYGLESAVRLQSLLTRHPELTQAKGQTTVVK
jgi:TolA-binding protein